VGINVLAVTQWERQDGDGSDTAGSWLPRPFIVINATIQRENHHLIGQSVESVAKSTWNCMALCTLAGELCKRVLAVGQTQRGLARGLQCRCSLLCLVVTPGIPQTSHHGNLEPLRRHPLAERT